MEKDLSFLGSALNDNDTFTTFATVHTAQDATEDRQNEDAADDDPESHDGVISVR